MKNINTNKVKPSCYGQKVCKVIRSVSKARDVVHDNKLVIYFLTHYAIIYNTVSFSFFLKKNKLHIKTVQCLCYPQIETLLVRYKNKTIYFVLYLWKELFLSAKTHFFMSQNILFFAIFYKSVVFLQPV